MSNGKGQRHGASIEQLRANRKVDAYNAGWNAAKRGHSGQEPRYLRFLTGDAGAFTEGYLASLHHDGRSGMSA